LRVPLYVAETEAAARAEPEASVMTFYRYLGRQIEESAALAGAREIEQRAERGQRLRSIGYDEVLRDKVVVGTADAVAERLGALRAELGLDGILAELNCGRLIPHEQVMRSLRLLCQEVMPKLRP